MQVGFTLVGPPSKAIPVQESLWKKKEQAVWGGRHNVAPPLQVDLWPFDLESGIRVTCDVIYLCANFSLPRPLCSRLRPDVRDRQTDVNHSSLLNSSALWGRGHNKAQRVISAGWHQ